MVEQLVALVLIAVEACGLALLVRRFLLPRLGDLKSKSSVVALCATFMTILAGVELTLLTGIDPLDSYGACRSALSYCEFVNEVMSVTMLIAAALLPLTYLYGWTVGSEMDEHFDWNARTR